MSTIRDIIQFADTQFQRKNAERKYEDQRNMQLAQLAYAKDKENKIIQSQRFLNDAVMKFKESGWEDGIYTGENVPDSTEVVTNYLDKMKGLGLAGDAASVSTALSQASSAQLAKDATALQFKVRSWDEANKNKYKDWNPLTTNKNLEVDRQAYLKSIGADKLYSKLYGTFGEAKAMEGTGLSPEDFGKNMSIFKEHPFMTGAGVVGAGALAYSKAGAIKDAASGLISKSTDPAEKKLLKNIKRFTSIQNVKNASRAKEAISKAEALVKEYTEKYGKNNKLSEAISGVKKPGLIKSGLGKGLAFTAADKVAEMAGSVIGGEKGAKIASVISGVGASAVLDRKFWKWAGTKLGGTFSKRMAAAGAASLADGPLPIADIISAIAITGLTANDLYNLTQEWETLSNK
jgi:hypothetical protein